MSDDEGQVEGASSSSTEQISPIQQMKSESTEPSCVSTKSDKSRGFLVEFKNGHSPIQQVTSDSAEPSYVSMKSDRSIEQSIHFKDGHRPIQQMTSDSADISCASIKSDQSVDELEEFKDGGRPHQTEAGYEDVKNQQRPNMNEVLKSHLREKFHCLYEGISKQGNPTLLNEIYTELYITEGDSGEISNEHEARQIETQSRRPETQERPIKCSDIFKAPPGQNKPIRTVLTKGVAGIGKTVSVQKFILDWAEGKENQDVHLIFPLPFREINLMKDKTLSLLDLLNVFFPETKEMEISSDEYKVLFIFDGLDECRLSLDFHRSVRLCDVSESASVDVLLTNLIKGNLLPSALIWITSRPAAAHLIPSECVDRVTEVRGFRDPQKEEYFRKRISDESLANRIISHLKSSRSLYIMCHIPVFCWISATVLQSILSEAESGEIPRTLTQMYTYFLIIQTNIKHEKDYEMKVKDEDMIFKLGKLAFEQLVKNNLIFYEEDLRECGIDVAEASVYSGLCTQIFREEFGLYQGKVYCFVHLSIQEHLAALYLHLTFLNDCTKVTYNFLHFTLSDLHHRAIDKALQFENGHLDLFLRFLLGLSVKSNQNLLQVLMTQTVSSSHSNEKTGKYIKQYIRENPSPEKYINLFHCLNELGDHSLVEEIQHYLKSRTISEARLSSSQWSAVVFVLLTSEQTLNEFNLSEFVRGNKDEKLEVLQKLLPVIQESRSVQLSNCNITDEGCAALASALRSNSSHLTELNLSWNQLGDSGVKLLSAGLESPHCKLEKLKLSYCNVTDEDCAALASALRSNSSHLRELNLSNNKLLDSQDLDEWLWKCNITDEEFDDLRSNPADLEEPFKKKLRDSGVKLPSAGLKNPHNILEILKFLRLRRCNITDEDCDYLASALRSNPSQLTKLDLFKNKVGDSGVKLLCAGLESPHSKLEILKMTYSNITDVGCAALASALRSNPSHLRELDLSDNKLGDSGVKLLSAGLKNPHCKLELLRLSDCNITEEGCAALASALRSNPSHLTELNLSDNKLGDSGVKLLSAVLKDSHCQLKILRLSYCNITDEGCAALASALKSNPSHLRTLNLSWNKLGDSGVKLLSAVLENPHCNLEILRLSYCIITDEGCAALASALRSNPSHLSELDLSKNKLNFRDKTGVKLFSAGLKNLKILCF